MIKFIMCCTRHPDMTREQFQDYWQNKHAPLFAKFADTLGTKKYIQCHTIDSPLNAGLQESRGMMQAYDGIAEVWFESEEALMEALDNGKVAFAGLDVFENEPTPRKDLLVNEKIASTPHIGAATTEAQTRIGLELAEQIINLLK